MVRLNTVRGLQCPSDLPCADLNGAQYDVLEDSPIPLEFSRLVHIGRPVLIKGTIDLLGRHTSALMYTSESAVPNADNPAKWTKQWLAEVMGDREISVAVTPNGSALCLLHSTLR